MSDPDRSLAGKLANLRRLIEQSSANLPARLSLARDLPAAGSAPRDGSAGRANDEPLPIEAVVPGVVTSNEYGPLFLSESVLPPGHRHGRWSLDLSLQLTRAAAKWLSFPAPVEAGDLRQAVFVDVETTGLAGGTGTLPFLVGLGWFEDGSFVIRQYLMRGPEEERAVLSEVAGALAGRGAEEVAPNRELVVSFNGKAFDLPLLETRYVLNRLRFPFPSEHLDLLFASRRVWGPRLESCRLCSLESSVLGVKRWNDVPGPLVPQLYYDYLRTGDGRCLAPVFDHNLLDVLSLVSLVGRLGQLYREPLLALEDAPEDLVAVGRCFERFVRGYRLRPGEGAGEFVEASLTCYREALAAGLAGGAAETARYRVSLIHKHLGERVEAVVHWEALAAGAAGEDLRFLALVELAKHYEHHTRNLSRALECVTSAQELVRSDAQERALQKRRARLLRKQRCTEDINGRHPA